jgi:hypothetical protein
VKPQRLGDKGRWAVIALLVLGGGYAYAGVGVRKPFASRVRLAEVQEPESVHGRRECPGEGVELKVDTGQMPPITFTVRHVPLSDSITNIPEFHDCQRFVVKSRMGMLAYDSLFAVFASFRLDSLIRDLRNSKDTLSITRGDSTALGVAGIVVKTVPVATVFSDHREYEQLGIAPGFNCLLLFALPAPGTWGAKMIPLTRPDSSCLSVDPHMKGMLLQVHPSRTPRLTEADYPDAARWDWDSVHSQQYIGIKCGAAWCQVGRPGFDTSASYSGPPLPFTPITAPSFTANESRRVTAVRGWYDEQRLNIGTDQPSGLRGILVPNPHIHNLQETPDRYHSTWVQVGFAVVIGGGYPKWNYLREVNEVLVCHGSARDCSANDAVLYTRIMRQNPERPSRLSPGRCQSGWLAAVGPHRDGHHPDDSRSKFFCLVETSHKLEIVDLNTRFPHIISSIPGTARWRWLVPDEGGWFGCISSSCCTKS